MIAIGLCLALALSASPAPVVYPPDASLTSEEYVRAGLPAPDRSWSPDDYSTAAAVLEKLALQDALLLPRFESQKSGVVFRRLIASENLSILRQDSAPVGTRVGLALEYLPGVKRVMYVYLAPASRNVVFDRELAECMGLLLAASAETVEVLAEFMAQLPPDDPKRQVRLDGLAKVRSGLSEVLAGSLESLKEPDTYRPPARRSLAAHIQATAPRLVRHLSGLQRAEVQQRLAALAAIEADTAVRDALVATAQAVQGDPAR